MEKITELKEKEDPRNEYFLSFLESFKANTRKPIFIIYVPKSMVEVASEYSFIRTSEAMEKDYHVLFVTHDSKEFQFKMFSDKEIEPIQLEELKGILKNNK